jgi:hypothetical protein
MNVFTAIYVGCFMSTGKQDDFTFERARASIFRNVKCHIGGFEMEGTLSSSPTIPTVLLGSIQEGSYSSEDGAMLTDSADRLVWWA